MVTDHHTDLGKKWWFGFGDIEYLRIEIRTKGQFRTKGQIRTKGHS